MPGLYKTAAIKAITEPLEHVYKVMAHPVSGAPFELPVERESLSVQFSEDWSPHVQANLAIPMIDDSKLDILDGRRRCRLTLHAGYRYPNQELDLQVLADLILLDREAGRPSNILELAATSDEILAQDRGRSETTALQNFPGINALVKYAAGQGMYPEPVTFSSEVSDTFGAAYTTGLDLPAGSDWWGLISDVANQCNVWVYCDEGRVWRVRNKATVGTAAHHVSVGQGGTLIRSRAGLGRTEWANQVILKYDFDLRTPTTEDPKKTTPKTVYGRAKVTGGPFAVTAVGYKTYTENRDITVSQAGADLAAQAVLKTMASRGRSLTIDAAAAYWVRPGQTITIQLLTGEVQTHLVAAVTFRPGTGEMQIKTRLPENVTITTGE